jgi:signal transduction histidine kinase
MQVMQHFSTRAGALWLGLFTLISGVPLVLFDGVFQGLALTLLYASVNILLAAFALATRRAQLARAENQATAQALQAANQELRARAAQLEQLAVVRARHSLARDLHDSVTQTIFSLTLTTQSALLLQERDPAGLRAQLDRMEELAQGALAEMHQLISELRPEPAAAGGLEATLRRHLAERHLPQGLSVSLEVEGGQALSPAEEQGLFRIAQEALNNIVKHAQASQACLRLHLAEPLWMEIEDQGQGFEAPAAPRAGGGVGLASMRERALEIGWTLQLTTAPGAGTRVRVEKQTGGE